MSMRNDILRAVRRALSGNTFGFRTTDVPTGSRSERASSTGRRLAGSRAESRFAAAVAGALIALAPHAGSAQSNVEGYVYGAALPGSEVRIENTETGLTRSATVQRNGSFRTPSVPPGTYKVTYKDSSGSTATSEVTVSIGAGTPVDTANVETVIVMGQSIPQVDMTNTESVTILTAERLEQLPVARDIQQVALLAPGAIQGDEGFLSQSGKPLISFSGASPGENTYYINGLNVTDFRNFLGGATVPFEFYDQFELRTGGYSAEFGRSLGGVINAVSKRGTNEFKYGMSTFWQPESLTSHRPDVYVTDPATGVTQQRFDNSADYNSEFTVNLQAGGPIIEDKLFFYALTVVRDVRDDDPVGTTAYSKTEDDSPFFGGKLDWQISDDHALEYTYMRDESSKDVQTYGYSPGQMGALKAIGTRDEGGTTHILRYSGALTENFALSALYGRQDRTQSNTNRDAVTGLPCVLVNDIRGGTANPLNCWDSANTTGQLADTTDERDAYRVDLSYFVGSHTLKLGYDYEKDTSDTDVAYEGGVGYRYSNTRPGTEINEGVVPDGVTNVARERFYSINGSFEQKLSAVFIEDSWQATDRLLLSLGLRNETLKNFNKNGEEFLDFGSQLTPRLGFSFDLLNDGKTKLFGNAGRYTMPIATNTNIRFAGGEFFTEQYYVLQGVNADGTPILGPKIGILNTLSDGTVPVPAQTVDSEIKPMYQDEFILGIQSALTDTTSVGLKVTHRDLVQAVEDSSFVTNGNSFYFLFNPGRGVRLQNPDGTYTTITAEQLGYPEAKRKYWAAQFTFDQRFGNTLRLGGSYTWSHTYGNFEGVFQSDIQQDDAGITIDFDTPGLAHFTNGDLPNDRRHVIKTYGTYAPVEGLTLSMNASLASGRPKNARGNCPTAVDPVAYDQDCFYVFGEPSPRASAGRLPWVYSLDLGVRYTPGFYDKVTVGLDVFNVFDFDRPTRITETAQQAGDENAPADPAYGTARYFQEPRYARISARWDF